MNELNFEELSKKIDIQTLLTRPLTDWRPTLSRECQVYVLGENYLAKRFDQINYKICEKNEAKEILIDNLYALLRFKYFPQINEQIDERINKIIGSFTTNLKTSLLRVSFDANTDAVKVKFLPDGCVAFRNGVFDFRQNEWLFKYHIINVESIMNHIYAYEHNYVIFSYIDIEFEPLPISINDTSLKEFIKIMKEMTKTSKNYCFELAYNMAHDINNAFSFTRFEHLCEILGYLNLQSFSQYFVLLIGSGQNGKNSLFDGCFTDKIVPRPASNDLDSIENDRFITGSLLNKAHNIFLETSAKTYTESKMLKALTGSMNQTIESKGVNKFSGMINCKYMFAGNDQDKIKFGDNTTGFRRRINVFEIWYRWDSNKKFLLKGDYYDTTFSDSLFELKEDLINIITFIYLGMYGIKMATSNFTRNFQFTYNEWKLQYSDLDFDLKEKFEAISPEIVLKYATANDNKLALCKTLFFTTGGERLYLSQLFKNLGYKLYEDTWKIFRDDEAFMAFFSENDLFMNVKIIQMMLGIEDSSNVFTSNLKKIYPNATFKNLYNNQNYIKITFRNKRLRAV